MKKIVLLGTLIVLMGVLVGYVGLAYAVELNTIQGSINALGTGYAITRWPYSNGDITVGETATVRAYTTRSSAVVTQVLFRWIRPDGSEIFSGPTNLAASSDTWNSGATRYAEDSQTINMGSTDSTNWGVQALFIGPDGKTIDSIPYPIVKIRAISWHPNVIPEVPLGTVVAAASMMVAFGGYFATRKRRLL